MILQAKAAALWQGGLAEWMQRWLPYFGQLVRGVSCTPETAFEIGWRVKNVELCCDFVNLDLSIEDACNFTATRGRRRLWPRLPADGAPVIEGHDLVDFGTISFSSRRGPSALCIYRKVDQLKIVKGVRVEECMYLDTWKQYAAVSELASVTRVELRLRGTALRLRPRKQAGVSTPPRRSGPAPQSDRIGGGLVVRDDAQASHRA